MSISVTFSKFAIVIVSLSHSSQMMLVEMYCYHNYDMRDYFCGNMFC